MNAIPRTPPFRLDGKRALVTGAGRGLGLAAAAALAQAGAEVILTARTIAEIEAVRDAIASAGGAAQAVQLDVTDLSAMQACIAALPALDILVNNAGTNRPAPFLEVAASDFDHVMTINVRAAFFVAQAVARKIAEERRAGSIINISSQMGHVGRSIALRNGRWKVLRRPRRLNSGRSAFASTQFARPSSKRR
jgi:NAD(P)-dependent dehydrogenase (short-subunit alcohol dehydrogenase family)